MTDGREKDENVKYLWDVCHTRNCIYHIQYSVSKSRQLCLTEGWSMPPILSLHTTGHVEQPPTIESLQKYQQIPGRRWSWIGKRALKDLAT